MVKAGKTNKKYTGINVLVIENDLDVLKLIMLRLKKFGCNVFSRKSGKQFLVEEFLHYQIILVSVLPDRAGIEFLINVKQAMIKCGFSKKQKFIAYTACGKKIISECIESGFDAVLEVPASLKDYEDLFEKFCIINKQNV
ncbi:MAG: response regulator [Bacteroidetes bacterium]|nr:response regulator [Bacteroidota bacterium]